MSKPCLMRLQKEYQRLNKEPVRPAAPPTPHNPIHRPTQRAAAAAAEGKHARGLGGTHTRACRACREERRRFGAAIGPRTPVPTPAPFRSLAQRSHSALIQLPIRSLHPCVSIRSHSALIQLPIRSLHPFVSIRSHSALIQRAFYDPPQVPNIRAEPKPNNILEWHFVIQGDGLDGVSLFYRLFLGFLYSIACFKFFILSFSLIGDGLDGTPYEGGQYHGKLVFPSDYPYKPPSIMMLTPSGRFETNKRLCLSMSDFHPETWVPAWSVASILNGVLSFMLESTPTVGSVERSLPERRRLAALSHAFNRKTHMFRELFADLVTEGDDDACAAEEAAAAEAPSRGIGMGWVLPALAVGVIAAAVIGMGDQNLTTQNLAP